MNILVVDDEPATQLLLEGLLTPLGECAIAGDGLEAVEQFEEKLYADDAFDLVLMDLDMPRMCGLDAVERIRALERGRGVPRDQQTRIVVLTALRDQNLMVSALQDYDVDMYIRKPIDADKLYALLRHEGLPVPFGL